MMKSKNWNENNKYYGKTVNEIEELWEKNRVYAANEGTKMHKKIEDFYNNVNIDIDDNTIEMNYFKKNRQNTIQIKLSSNLKSR